jgi:nucleotide-binding universal stress UspA family protein
MLNEQTESSRSPADFQRVMIAVDGSKPATDAVHVGADLARRFGAAIAVVHVVDVARGFTPELGILDERLLAEQKTAGLEVLDKAHHAICPAGDAGVMPVTRLLREGDPASEIVAAAKQWHADVIVVGTHARGAVGRLLLGSTAEAVLRRAHCPVLTVRHLRADPNEFATVPINEPVAQPQRSGAPA